MIKKYSFLAVFLFFIQFSVQSQNLNQQEVKDFTKECHDLIAYLQFTLNSIGDVELSPKEKDIIISESYTKLFRDGKVQVEDDLVPDREAVTNKDVQAYLKDVDFFFSKVLFSYKVLSVDLLQDEKNQAFFKIHTLRTLSGNTLQNDSIHNEQARFIEVAVNPDLRELKIVSIYTTKLKETEENIKWWNELPISWKGILGEKENICENVQFSRVLNIQHNFVLIEPKPDSIALDSTELVFYKSLGMSFNSTSFDTLRFGKDSIGLRHTEQIQNALNRILAIKELNLSKRLDISNIEPLSKISSLQSLNISGTLINDIYPIRNLIDLQYLNISNTQVSNLDALIYSMALQNLDLSNTKIYSLEPLINLSKLKVINFSNTHIDDISALAPLKTLNDIKMDNTMVTDLSPLENHESLNYLFFDNCPISNMNVLSSLKELKILSCNNTMISSLQALSKLENLSVLYCENTEISSLKPLDDMSHLTKIYCDNTLLGKEKALDYMSQNPNVLVVFESQKLQKWFLGLPNYWKEIFNSYVEIDMDNPSKEQLHQVAAISEIDISGKMDIETLEPLSRVQSLKKLNASNTQISSIDALYELRELNWLDLSSTSINTIAPLENLNSLNSLNISKTQVEDLTPLQQSHSLKKLIIESTNIRDIHPLMALSNIMELFADHSQVDKSQFEEFMIQNPKCLVIYQSDELANWWKELPSSWNDFFTNLQGWSNKPNSLELHQLVKTRELSITNNRNIQTLEPLNMFVLLENLQITGTQVTNLDVLANLSRLRSLDLSQNPITQLEAIGGLKNLNSIKISDTQIDYLDWASSLTKLEFLDISGTQIKNLKPLSSLYMLESLMAYNTRISNLSPLDGLVSLRKLKIYNTRVNSKKVDQFKYDHPSCVVDYF